MATIGAAGAVRIAGALMREPVTTTSDVCAPSLSEDEATLLSIPDFAQETRHRTAQAIPMERCWPHMARLPFRERREIARHELGRGSSPDPLKIFPPWPRPSRLCSCSS
jgi:hypothetical protein